jgi:hypothetical protein
MLTLLIILFLALHAADLALTLRGVAIGKRERNPVARFLMRRLGRVQGMVLLKVVMLGGVFLLAARLPPAWQAAAFAILSLVGVLVVRHNLRVLGRGRRAGR